MQQEVNVAFILGRKAFFQHHFPPPPKMHVDAPVGTLSPAACLERMLLLLLGAGSLNGSAITSLHHSRSCSLHACTHRSLTLTLLVSQKCNTLLNCYHFGMIHVSFKSNPMISAGFETAFTLAFVQRICCPDMICFVLFICDISISTQILTRGDFCRDVCRCCKCEGEGIRQTHVPARWDSMG